MFRLQICDARFGHFPPNLLNSLDGGFAKLVASPLQFIDFKGLKKMTEPWDVKFKVDHLKEGSSATLNCMSR